MARRYSEYHDDYHDKDRSTLNPFGSGTTEKQSQQLNDIASKAGRDDTVQSHVCSISSLAKRPMQLHHLYANLAGSALRMFSVA
ncbi:hypothetical protein AJ80_05917 [Polytolypa hystricis UAMH7299]|uniref:Uncharacterized protein n=1 Tax=Polytolypa hystricis (strain UAMH7299) TaxID=1447883 RepID=A0A2B7Y0S8_POLH7|nr:hypothetical protein AJ80_05917 [Polytolypa hystricis UAMH7299]